MGVFQSAKAPTDQVCRRLVARHKQEGHRRQFILAQPVAALLGLGQGRLAEANKAAQSFTVSL
jgi:hypothetical protein